MHKKKATVKIAKKDMWKIAAIALGVLLIISILTGGFSSLATSKTAASEKALAFINENLLQPGTTATLLEVKRTGDLYNLQLEIDGRTYNSFVTRDASLLCPSAIPLDSELSLEN